MATIENREDLERWLEGKPVEVSRVIALRAALRVVPITYIVFGEKLTKLTEPRVQLNLVFRIFQAISSAITVSVSPSNAEVLKQYAFNAFDATDELDAEIFDASYSLASTFDAVGAAAAVAVVAPSAEFAIDFHTAFDAATAFAVVSGKFPMWRATSNDCSALDSGVSPAALAASPLWPEGAPDWFTQNLADLTQRLDALGDDWDVWTRWLARVVAGGPFDVEMELRRVKIEPEDWDKGPAHVNALIKRLEAERARELEPPEAEGARFSVRDGRLTLLATALDEENAESGAQRALHQRIRNRLKPLKENTDRVGNQLGGLKTVVDEYAELAEGAFDDLDVDALWSVGNGLIAHAEAFAKLNATPSTTHPLEPTHLALLTDVAGLHGGFILGFPRGVELTDRADRARLAAHVIAAIESPTLGLLDKLGRKRTEVEERTQRFLLAVAEGVRARGWETARTGYTAYAATRNALLAIGRAALWANDKGGSIAGSLALAAVDPNFAQTLQWIEFLKSNARDILAFAEHFPELRAWLRSIIDHFDLEKKN